MEGKKWGRDHCFLRFKENLESCLYLYHRLFNPDDFQRYTSIFPPHGYTTITITAVTRQKERGRNKGREELKQLFFILGESERSRYLGKYQLFQKVMFNSKHNQAAMVPPQNPPKNTEELKKYTFLSLQGWLFCLVEVVENP